MRTTSAPTSRRLGSDASVSVALDARDGTTSPRRARELVGALAPSAAQATAALAAASCTPPPDDPAARIGFGALLETAKPRITRLVSATAAVGFIVAATLRPRPAGELVWAAPGAIVGTALAAAGANALNQWLERRRDALMPRTATRPLPQCRASPEAVLAFGVTMAGAGVGLMTGTCGLIPAMLALASVLLYVLVYTPLKVFTPHATIVGAIPGALPPIIGWTAAQADRGLAALGDPGAWSLFLILFVWQIPHFLAIGWLHRDEYAAAGFRLLPVLDATGRRTSRAILLWSTALVPVSASPGALMHPAPGSMYAIIAAALAAGFLGMSWRAARTLQRADARRAFLASIVHLPLTLMLLLAFAGVSRLLF